MGVSQNPPFYYYWYPSARFHLVGQEAYLFLQVDRTPIFGGIMQQTASFWYQSLQDHVCVSAHLNVQEAVVLHA